MEIYRQLKDDYRVQGIKEEKDNAEEIKKENKRRKE